MSDLKSIRSVLPLLIGLVVGGVGVILFQQSLPGEEGSAEERSQKLEVQLKSANNRIAALEASDGSAGRRPGQTLSEGIRGIADRIRAGGKVSPNEIFRASQPLLRELSPILDRMRALQEKQMIDSRVGELSRKYNLAPAQQQSLKLWFEQQTERNAKAYNDLVVKDGTSIEDLMKASMQSRADDGLDEFMPNVLRGQQLAQFKTQRLAERAERVQSQADARVQRIDNIVALDEAQRDKIFAITARSSKDYDSSMQLEGAAGAIGLVAGGDPNEAIVAVLRPDQRETYEADKKRKRDDAEKNMNAVGLTLPGSWDSTDSFNFD